MKQLTALEKETRKMKRLGLGQGEGTAYRPLVTIWDARHASRRMHRLPYLGRTGEYIDDYHYAAFLSVWWQDDVIEIRESYPLQWEVTVALGRKLHIPHPRHSDGSPRHVVTDLLVTRLRNGVETAEAYSVCRPSRQSGTAFALNRAYWSLFQVPWSEVRNEGMNSARALNLEIFYSQIGNPRRAGEGADNAVLQAAVMHAIASGGYRTARQASEGAAKRLALPAYQGVNAYHLLLALKLVRCDLDAPSVDDLPVTGLELSAEARQMMGG